MTREEARVLLKNLNNQVTSAFYGGDFWVEEGTFEAFEVADAALRGSDPDTGLMPCGGKMRIDIPPGNDSVRASTGFQRDGGDKTESRCNQCIHCGQEMPEGDQVCGHCRRQHGY